MKYLKISNNTEIDVNAFRLIGACTKRDDNSKIGYFGSGLKYAIAVLLRDNVGLKVYSGKKEFPITVESEIFRGQPFNIVSVCGKKTSLTTSMGVDWKAWQAVREIFCNALDESEPSHEIVNSIEPKKGTTSFYIPIENKDVQYIIDNWDKYFAHNRKPIVGDCCKIYESIGDKVNVYRKGIRCWDEKFDSLYDYDFSKIDISESRTAKYSWEIKEGIAKLWGKYATNQMITRLVRLYKVPKETEACIENLADWNYAEFSNIWLEYFKDKILVPQQFAGWFPRITEKPNAVIVNITLMRCLKETFGDAITVATEEMDSYGQYCIAEMDARQAYLLKECMSFLEEVKLSIPYDIRLAIFNDKKILGMAKKGKILLSAKLFDMGKKRIVTTIIEECAHLESDQSDDSRGFQDYLVGQIVTMLENQHGIFL